MSGRFLIDKSALARYPKPVVRAVIEPLHNAGLLAVCGAVELEVLHSARSSADAARIRDGMRGFDWLPTPDEAWDRALEVQAALVGTGNWRALSVADLVIAAVAERHGATVLHYDGDYDMIAKVTGQPTRWVVPPGTAD
ncbi:putative nucleic acid-binding protein [Kitasatospora sp. MAP12-15]|uniref:PIN domain nuclease n=1 Tax=unclassified Kitasatospora TaxID=2633591 RepID=UPI00247408F3|nr:PIN domain nuclease [Kitasatospora sp. MAP12-44]MDH6112773.1 putative nucleic acid-binding protein [Kitasatospora sp. MAP12-44]